MNNLRPCLGCFKKYDRSLKKCPYCGYSKYGENDEFKPTAFHYAQARKILNGSQSAPKRKKSLFRDPIFSLEERLTLGLYPKSKTYRMSLISLILGKRR